MKNKLKEKIKRHIKALKHKKDQKIKHKDITEIEGPKGGIYHITPTGKKKYGKVTKEHISKFVIREKKEDKKESK